MPIAHASTLTAGMAVSRPNESRILPVDESKKKFKPQQERDYGRPSIDTTISSDLSHRGAMSSSKSIRSASTATSTMSPLPNTGSSIRVYTKGAKLSSGFDYHPALFDLNVHPTKWEKFSSQVVESTKLSFGDNANAWATGILSFTIFPHPWHIGMNQSRRLQEKRVKTGLRDISEGALGDVLQTWNEGYFEERGLIASLELSEEALRSPSQQSSLLAGEAHWHRKKQDRDRHRQERKFVLVVARLAEEPQHDANVLHELSTNEEPWELINVGSVKCHTAEAPGDHPQGRIELPGDFKRAELPGCDQYSELDATNEDHLKNESPIVTAGTQAVLSKELNPKWSVKGGLDSLNHLVAASDEEIESVRILEQC